MNRFKALLVVSAVFAVHPATALAAGPTHVPTTTYSTSTTWAVADSPYVLDGDVTVESGATLSIEPGVIVKLNGQFRSINVNGTLSAIGTSTAPIVFTSYADDSAGGDTNGDGAATTGAAGQWYHVAFASAGSHLSYVTMRDGAYGSGPNYAAVYVYGSGYGVTIDNSTFTNNQKSAIFVGNGASATIASTRATNDGYGVYVDTASVSIAGSTLSDNSGNGLRFNLPGWSPLPATTHVTDTEIARNGGEGVYIGANGSYPLDSMPTGTGNNIYANNANGIQLTTSGYPGFANANVNWRGNYWGAGVQFTPNPAGCSASSPYATGHLTYGASTSGPINGNSYLLPPTYTTWCYYDAFSIGECQFATEPLAGDTEVVDFVDPKTVSDALSCADAGNASVAELQSDFDSTECPGLRAAYIPDTNETTSQIGAGFAPMMQSLFYDANTIGDVSCTYPGTAKVSSMVLQPNSTCTPLDCISFPQNNDGCYAEDFSWWPNSGKIQTGPSWASGYTGQRFIYQTFVWTQSRIDHIKDCANNVTYEPDAVFDNYDGLHYFGNRRSWLSNLPRDYKDTRRDDSSNEPTYTVGTADATKLVGGRTYFTLTRTNPGNATTDRGKVQGQIGHRTPDFCYRSLCIFANATHALVPAWDVTVPGVTTWTG